MRYFLPLFPNGKYKAVTLSYDDGRDTDKKLSEILNKYGIKCTFNINSGYIPKQSGDIRLSAEEIQKYILDCGHEIAVHGEFHVAPGVATKTGYIMDTLNCRLALEKEFNIIVNGMAYPNSGIRRMNVGNTYEEIKHDLKSLGIVYARSLGSDNDNFELPTDWFNWLPTAYHKNPDVIKYAEEFANLEISKYPHRRSPKLFYLWGHSYEFRDDNNWDLIEKLCQILGQREDTWYATNIEIYNYIEAFKSLVFSADNTIAYNPTVHTVWFESGDKQFVIKSGETLVLK